MTVQSSVLLSLAQWAVAAFADMSIDLTGGTPQLGPLRRDVSVTHGRRPARTGSARKEELMPDDWGYQSRGYVA
jgi:hypothetical protein